jgi:hypothetical protein
VGGVERSDRKKAQHKCGEIKLSYTSEYGLAHK